MPPQQGRQEDAVRAPRRALAADPSSADAHGNLGTALQAAGRHDEALAHYAEAVALSPGLATAHDNYGKALLALHRPVDAVAAFEKAVALAPDLAPALSNLGTALLALGRHEAAMASYRRALAVAPRYADAHYNLGNALQALNRHAEAAQCYARALALQPDLMVAHNNLGNSLQALDRHVEAIACYRQALALRPDAADAHNNLGAALKSLGRFDEAVAAFEKAAALAPERAEFHRNLADSRRITPGDPALRAMTALAGRMAAMPQGARIQLHFALGKAYADTGQHALSFGHFQRGNTLRRREIVYDEGNTLRLFDRTRTVFTRDLIQAGPGLGDPSDRPVFIVGMPRSGTSLVEQILASHPQVFGAGELPDIETLTGQLTAPPDAPSSFPELAATLPPAGFRAFGQRYLARLTALAPEALRITDKMPANFRHLGLLHRALPNARIIHTRRDPIDTCLSCFSILFNGTQPYAYDLAELGRYYRGYDRLMAHWRAVLPPGVMLEVRYEDIVADLDGEARRILAHCGLAWDPACLAFHRTERPVRTASAAQVRQPLYATSVGRSFPYREWLGPLVAALDGDTGAPP